MKTLRRLLSVGILGVTLYACSDSSSPVTAPEEGYLANGSGFGSGHREGSDSTSSITASDSTSLRNGSGFGSGH